MTSNEATSDVTGKRRYCMVATRRLMSFVIHSTVLLLCASTLAAAASVTVIPTVTLSGGVYTYSYSITNNTPDDAFLIDIPVLNNSATVRDLTTPAGFAASFDARLGLVSFLEDPGMFGSTAKSGFSFESADAPGAAVFEASLLRNTSGSLYTLSGLTRAPVPEPGYSLPVGLLGVVLLTFSSMRRAPARTKQQ